MQWSAEDSESKPCTPSRLSTSSSGFQQTEGTTQPHRLLGKGLFKGLSLDSEVMDLGYATLQMGWKGVALALLFL